MNQNYLRQMFGTSPTIRHRMDNFLHLDIPMLLLLLAISLYGLLILYSAAGQQLVAVISQSIRILVGLGAMVVIAQVSPILYLRFAPWIFLASLMLLGLTLAFGTEVNGSRRWLQIPGLISFQPSEVMKLVLPMILAWYFHDRHLPPRAIYVLGALIIIALPVMLIAMQPDLGTALIIAAAGLFVLLLAGISWRLVFSSLGLAFACSSGSVDRHAWTIREEESWCCWIRKGTHWVRVGI